MTAVCQISQKWLRPRTVETKAAHPFVSRSIGRTYSQVFGLASAYSENTTPTGPAPTTSILSDPISRQIDPFLSSTSISAFGANERGLLRIAAGNTCSMIRSPSRVKPVQIERRACSAVG